MENKFFSKKHIIILDIIIVAIVLIVLAKIGIEKLIIKNEMKTAEHAVTINETVHMYSAPREKKKYTSIELGSDTYILKTVTDKDDTDWYKVIIDGKARICQSKRCWKI